MHETFRAKAEAMTHESEATPRPEARPKDRSKAEARDKAFAWRPKTDRGTDHETEARPMRGRGEGEDVETAARSLRSRSVDGVTPVDE